jgi:hypothetical protein
MAIKITEFNLAADGQTATFGYNGGKRTFVAYGTWGSGTLKLQWSPDDGTTWIDEGTDSELTANGDFSMDADNVSPGLLYRLDLSGSTSPDLDIKIIDAP